MLVTRSVLDEGRDGDDGRFLSTTAADEGQSRLQMVLTLEAGGATPVSPANLLFGGSTLV